MLCTWSKGGVWWGWETVRDADGAALLSRLADTCAAHSMPAELHLGFAQGWCYTSGRTALVWAANHFWTDCWTACFYTVKLSLWFVILFYDRLSGSLRELLRPNLVCTKKTCVHTLHSFVWDTAFLFIVEINFIKWL